METGRVTNEYAMDVTRRYGVCRKRRAAGCLCRHVRSRDRRGSPTWKRKSAREGPWEPHTTARWDVGISSLLLVLHEHLDSTLWVFAACLKSLSAKLPRAVGDLHQFLDSVRCALGQAGKTTARRARRRFDRPIRGAGAPKPRKPVERSTAQMKRGREIRRASRRTVSHKTR